MSHDEPPQHHDDERHASKNTHKNNPLPTAGPRLPGSCQIIAIRPWFYTCVRSCTLNGFLKLDETEAMLGSRNLQNRGRDGDNVGTRRRFLLLMWTARLDFTCCWLISIFPLTKGTQPVQQQFKTKIYTQKTSLLCT